MKEIVLEKEENPIADNNKESQDQDNLKLKY